MAVVGAAHGIRGEVRVKTFTGDPMALADYGPLATKDGRSLEILDIRPAGTVVVVRFKGVGDRNAAEALNGTELFVDRSALPDDGDEDAFYHADLVGLDVRDETGQTIGTVTAVQNFGGGDLLEIRLGSTPGVLLPFTRAAVPEVDVEGGFVRIDSVAAGLVETDSQKEGEGAAMDSRPRGPRESGGNR